MSGVPILVTGSRGFAGRHLVARLRAGGRTVVGLDRTPVAHPDDVTADLGDAESVRDLVVDVRPDRVYHLAGAAFEPRDSIGRSDVLRATLDATASLASALAFAGGRPRVLVAGSCSVYGVPVRPDGRVVEDDPIAPVLFYGFAKASQEMLLALYHRRGVIDLRVARIFNLSGPGEGQGSVLGTAAFQAAAGGPVRLGNLGAVRDFLDVRDAAVAFETIVERGDAGGVYNVGSGRGIAVRSVVERVLAATGAALEHDPARDRPVDVPAIFADVVRLDALGFRSAYTLDDTVAAVVAAQRKE